MPSVRLSVTATLFLTVLSATGGAQGADESETTTALIAPLAPRSLLLDGMFRDGLMVAVGERGHVLVSEDQGENWEQASVPTRATLTGVYLHDRHTGWAVGHDAVIIKTTDGGRNWVLKYSAPEAEAPLLDVWFKDAQHGFAVGAYGLFLKTDDGGESWQPRVFSAEPISARIEETESDDEAWWETDVSADLHLNQITRSGMGRLYLAAEAGTTYRSDDYGETWVVLASPYVGSFFGTLPLDGDSVLLFGLRGHLFSSADAGEAWEEIETGTEAMLTDGIRLGDGTIVLTGLAGTILVSHDDGRTFTLRQQPDRKGYVKVLPGAAGALILMGEGGLKKLRLDEANDEGS